MVLCIVGVVCCIVAVGVVVLKLMLVLCVKSGSVLFCVLYCVVCCVLCCVLCVCVVLMCVVVLWCCGDVVMWC